MATMIRKQIYLEAEQDALLKRLAGETGKSEAELIRQAVDRLRDTMPRSRRDLNVWAAERSFIESLIAQSADATSRAWTRDDLYDR